MAKTHSFSEPTLGSRTSPYLQEKLVLLGSYQVFQEVPALVESLLGITVSESQAYRTLQMVSQVMEDPSIPSKDLQQIQGQADE